MPRTRWDLRMDVELGAWADEYAELRNVSRTQVVEFALKELRALAATGVPDLPSAPPKPRHETSRVRRCFVCEHPDCARRVFLTPMDPEGFVPSCEHGPMVRDRNRVYFGQPTPV